MRRALGWILLTTSLVLWPVSAITFAKDEPFTVLSLSWFAITLTAVDILFTAQVKEESNGGCEKCQAHRAD